jgi:hypothetical protein
MNTWCHVSTIDINAYCTCLQEELTSPLGLGYGLYLGSKTRREVNGDFQVDIQDKACCI